MDYSNFEKFYKSRRHLPIEKTMLVPGELIEGNGCYTVNIFVGLFNEWIDAKYKEYYADKRKDISYLDDDFCIIKSFPPSMIIKLLQFIGYNYGKWPNFALVSDITKYMYSMWKEYKLLDENKVELLKLKRTIKFCKREIKGAIQNVFNINKQTEYYHLIKTSRLNYKWQGFGFCQSRYYKYYLYIYIPLLKNSEAIITKIIDTTFLVGEDAQRFLLWGLIRFDLNTLNRVTKNLILQLLSVKTDDTESLECDFKPKCFEPLFGSQLGKEALRYCIAKLFRNEIYILDDPEIIKACEISYGKGVFIKYKYFGIYTKENSKLIF